MTIEPGRWLARAPHRWPVVAARCGPREWPSFNGAAVYGPAIAEIVLGDSVFGEWGAS
jgi:hypothetical protein